jgi:hypothetical protein
MPFPVKKMDTSFSGFNNKPQPTISPKPFHLGLIAPFGHSKVCELPESQQ